MMSNWKRRQWGIVHPQLEMLEGREVPAGNIQAFVTGGVLTIRSDNDDFHAFNIQGCGSRSVVIRPEAGCTINGNGDPRGVWVGNITRGFDIQTGNGNDSVIISNVHGQDFLSIVTNGGDDVVHIVNGTRSHDSTWVRTGDGNDIVIVNGSTFRDHFAIDTGTGNDQALIGPGNDFGRGVFFNGGDGTDALSNTGNHFRDPATIANFESNTNGLALPPQAVNDAATLGQNKSTTVTVLANDNAVTGTLSPSSVRITAPPSRGTATVNADGTITYTNNGSSTLSDSFRYTVQNSFGKTSNEATVNLTITDTSGPTTNLTTSTTDPTKSDPIPFTVEFSESVTGFDSSDITVTGGTVLNFAAVSGSKFTFGVDPTADGTVTVSVGAGKATDSGGNGNLASNSITRGFDSTAPTVTANALSTNDTTPTLTGTVNDSTATVVVTVNDVNVTATVSGTTWSAAFGTEIPDGKYTIAVAATDKAGNIGTANLADGLVIDSTPPTITITSTLTSPTGTSPIPITVTFSEDVTGFVEGDVTIGNGTLANFTVTSGSVYKFDIVPTINGAVTVDIAAGVAADAATNPNTAAPQFSITFNSANPTLLLSTTVGDPTKTTPIPVTAQFGSDVTGFVIGDITITGGTASNFVVVNGSQYKFDVTPSGQGTVTISVAADVAQDTDGDGNLASNTLTRVFDSLAPTTVINPVITNDTTPVITGTVSETGTTVEVSANGIIVQAVVTGKTWTATFTTVFADGTYNTTAVAKDAAGNQTPNLLAGGLIVDTVAPTLSISSTENSPSSASPIPIIVQANEEITGFEESDLTVSGGTVSNFMMIDAQTFSFDITPTADGTISVSIADNAVTDLAGNSAPAPDTFTIDSDTTAPTGQLITTASSPTNLAAIPIVANFSEVMSGLTPGQITVNNGTIANLVVVNGSKFTFDVLPNGDGHVSVSIAAGAATDAAGNPVAAVGPLSITSDRTAPSLVLNYAGQDPTNELKLAITATFSEAVTGFVAGDVVVTNGVVANFVAVDAANYTFDVVPAGDGPVGVSVAANAAIDDAANNSTAATGLVITSDTTAPTGQVTSSASSPTNLALIPFTVTFSEVMSGLTPGQVTVVNGTIQNFVVVDGQTFTFDVAPTADGDVIVSVAAGAATDAAGNPNVAVPPLTVVSDRGPTTLITTTATSPSNANSFAFTVQFSEAVTGFIETDVVVANGTLSKFTMVDALTYTFDIAPVADGDVSVGVPVDVAFDAATNGNQAATTVTIVSDSTSPTATISTDVVSSPTNADLFPFTVTFNEDVTGFVEGDVVVANGTISNFTMVDAKTYTFDVTPTADGNVTVSVAAAVAADAAGNDNSVATDVTIVSDRTEPTPVVTFGPTSPTSVSPIPFTITFDEDVTGFAEAAIIVSNGTVGNFLAVNGSTYTFDVTPLADGDVTVSVASNFAADAAGNLNNAGAAVTIVFDNTDPIGAINGTDVQQISGTASDASGVTRVRVSIHNGVAFWDGLGFNSASEILFDATSGDNFATWAFAFTIAGTYSVNAEITDTAGNIAIVTNNNVTVS